ncbi:MAG: EAL domain-containing protein [Chloroflexus sp.]|nr:EAL domain-containing protein [Chloroflexus sp.]
MQYDPSAFEPRSTADRLSSCPDQRSLQAIVANNANALLVLDLAGTVLFANEAALRLFGRQADQVQGSPFGFPLQPGLTVDAEIVRPDHSVVIVDLRVEPIEWDGAPAMLAVLHDITERKQAEQLLIETQQLLHSALDALPSAIAILNQYGQVLAANVRWLQLGPLLGVDAIDCTVGSSFLAACQLGVGPAVVVAAAIEQLLASELERYEAEFATVTQDRCWLAVRAVRFGAGERVRVVIVLEDVSVRHQAEQIGLARRRVLELIARQYDLRTIAREMLQLISEQMTDLVYAAYVIRSAAVFASYSRQVLHDDLPLLDQWAHELLVLSPYRNQRINELEVDSPHWQTMQSLIQMHVINRSWIIALRTNRDPADGWLLLCRRTDAPLAPEDRQLIDHIEQLTTIALEQHTTLHKLAYQAHHDSLTGLPNRLLFEDRLQQAIELARRSNTLVAVLFIDLDRFKQVNDTLGHAIGDLLLIQVARRFELCVRATDTLARHGGDEFLLALPEIDSPQQVIMIARRLHEALEHPFFINGHEIFVSASIGASLYPIDGTDVITLQRAADMAMYRAKGTLRNSFQFFDAAITHSSLEQLQIETLLRRAIERNELLLHYQPKVDRAGKLAGFEALIRWQNAELGFVSPARFIPIAEETGLIVPIGAWVLHEIARQMQAWRQQGLPIVPVAANVSALQFAQTSFVQMVAETLAQADLPAGWLELELTESMLMGQIDNLRRQLTDLRRLGVTLAIDDFGTGYSSLAYLHRLPINVLKIDRSFVACLDQADAVVEQNLVNAIISLGHHLGMQIVAEGVETAGQHRILLDAGCDMFQGYYIGRPLPAEAVVAWLQK